MASFYTHVSGHQSPLPYCSLDSHNPRCLLCFLWILIELSSFTTVLTIFTFNDWFSCQSLILTEVRTLEKWHLRLVSLETNSRGENCIWGISWDAFWEDLSVRRQGRQDWAEGEADLQCSWTSWTWGSSPSAGGAGRGAGGSSGAAVALLRCHKLRQGSRSCFLYLNQLFILPLLLLLPCLYLPGGLSHLEWGRYLWSRAISSGRLNYDPLAVGILCNKGMGKHSTIVRDCVLFFWKY